jgi:hypothetical protein
MFDTAFKDSIEQGVEFRLAGDGEFEITEVETPPYIAYSIVQDAEANAKAIAFKLKDKTLPAGVERGTINLHVSDAIQRNVQIPVMAFVRETLVAEPAYIYMRDVTPDELEKPLRVVVRRLDNNPFRIVSATIGEGGPPVEFDEDAAATSHTLNIVWGDHRPAKFRGALEVWGEDERTDHVKIPIAIDFDTAGAVSMKD